MARTPSKSAKPAPQASEAKKGSSIEDSIDVPAYYATTTATVGSKTVVRITFGESVRSKTKFHTAVVLSKKAAVGLAESILEMYQEDDDQDSSDEEIEVERE